MLLLIRPLLLLRPLLESARLFELPCAGILRRRMSLMKNIGNVSMCTYVVRGM